MPSKTRSTPLQRATSRTSERLGEDPDAATALGNLRGEANELKRVSETLLPMEQDRFSAEMFTSPSRLGNAESGWVTALEAPLGLGPAAFEVAVSEPAQGAIAVGLTEIWAKLDGLVVVSHGLGPEVLAGESHCEVVPGVGGIGAQGQCGAKPVDGIVKLTQVGEGDAQIHLSVERMGLELERFSVERDGAIGAALLPEHDSQVVQDSEVVWFQLVGAEEIRHCFGGATLFPDGGAQVVEDVRIIRIQVRASRNTGSASACRLWPSNRVPWLKRVLEAEWALAGGRFTAWGMRTWTSPFMG